METVDIISPRSSSVISALSNVTSSNKPVINNSMLFETSFPECKSLGNPDSSNNTAKQAERLISLTLLPLLELFGIVTNVISALVFCRQGLKDRINLCLFSLALADICFLVLSFSARFYSFLGLFSQDLENYWQQRHLNTVLGPMLASQIVSNLMTLIISVERCICVVSPFSAKKFLKTRYMAVVIIAMAVYIMAFYSLLDLKFVTVKVTTNPLTNSTRWVSKLSDFFTDHQVIIVILYNHLLGLAVPCTSLVVVIVTTSITVTKLRTSQAWRQETAVAAKSSAGAESREAAVTKMLTVVCLIYVSTITPSVTQTFCRTFVPGYITTGRLCDLFTFIQALAHVMEVTNSSVNFIVYYSMGSKFRATLRTMACTAICGRQRTKKPRPRMASSCVDNETSCTTATISVQSRN